MHRSSGLKPLQHEVPGKHWWRAIELPEHAEPQSLVEGAGLKRLSIQPHLMTPTNTCFLFRSFHQFRTNAVVTKNFWCDDQRDVERTPQRLRPQPALDLCVATILDFECVGLTLCIADGCLIESEKWTPDLCISLVR